MKEAEYLSRIANMVKECEDYGDELSKARTRSLEYYDGVMHDTPAEPLRSKVVSRDVRATIKKALPSISRTILGNDEVVEYSPVGEEDVDTAAQASDYVNYVILPESGGFDVIYDAIHDAMKLRNGVIRWWWETKVEISVSQHSGLSDADFSELVNNDEITVLAHSERQEVVEFEEAPEQITVHDVTIRREREKRQARVAAVPPEEFLIHPDATDIEGSIVVGMKTKLSRSDLVAMGYDRKQIDKLPLAEKDDEEEADRRGDNYSFDTQEAEDKALQEVDYYDLYVRTDLDGDGIAELRHMCFAGKVSEEGLLENDYADEVQYCSLKIERKPHQWEGISISDDVMEIQRIKTVLLRQTLDNLYWQNNPQPVVEADAIENPDSVVNPSFGRPIFVKAGFRGRDAVSFANVPFVAAESFGMLEYLDQEVTDRTGVSDASAGLPPDALQNVTAKASAMLEQGGIGQTEQIVRTIANDLKPLFRGLLRLIVRHQDIPRTVRLRKEWVQFDPRHWNASMDATVNTGLGAGSRERDMAMMQMIADMQERILGAMGFKNPFVKPENIYNVRAKMIEAGGLRSPGLYISEPSEEEIAEHMESERNKPNPEMEKVNAQILADQMKAQASQQEAAAKMQFDQQKMVAESNLKREQMAIEANLKREQMVAEMELKREQLAAELQLKRELALVDRQTRLDGEAIRADATSQVHVGGEPG